MTRRWIPAAALLLLVICVPPALAQSVAIDRGVRAGGLWCFPLNDNPKEYVYLPASARLAEDEAGRPQFSFVRYVTNAPVAGEPGTTISDAAGGGVLHFLVVTETPPETVANAQQALRRALNDTDVVVRGPVAFQDGRYALVSSIVSPDSGTTGRQMLAAGRAPVLEGNRIAFSFDLKPQQASLLMQSFQMNTPDISIVFDMTFTGLSDAYDAELSIDWSEVRKSEAFGAGGSVYYVGADVQAAFDELRRRNAIKLRSSGTDAAMEALLTTVYSKLLDLMFKPVEPDNVPPDKQAGLVEAIGALVDPKGPLGSRKTTGFGLDVAYQLKDLRTSGVSVLDFNHRAAVERHSFVTFNIGDFYRRFGRDPNYFRAINLADPTFQQREVHVAVDGALVPDFDRYINAVTVTLRKRHQDGEMTIREVVLDRAAISSAGGDPRLVYGWSGDDDRLAWLQYEYRTRWSFKGGGTYETGWTATDAPLIDLFAPYERRTVQVVGDAKALAAKHVRAVIVLVEYSFFGERRRHQLVVRPDGASEDPQVQITLPLGQFEYDYSITWQLDGGRRLALQGHESSGVVFIDELPADGSPGAARIEMPTKEIAS